MNPQVPDELISAYFDGEVSPDERVAVEGLLAASDEAQRELNETARLSALLHSFPRESAPVGLAGNIQRQTNQLPLPVRAPAPATPSTRHVWLQLRAAFVSCITTAAVYAIVVNMADTSPRRDAPVALTDKTRTSETPASAPDVAMADAAPAFGPAGGMGQPLADLNEKELLRGPSEASKLSAPRPRSATPAGGGGPLMRRAEGTADAERFPKSLASREGAGKADLRDAGAANQGFGNGGAAGGAAPSQAAPVDAPQIDNYSNLLSNQSFLEKLQEGKMYTFVPQAADPDNNAAVVDLMVVDIDRATEQILVLLGKPENQPRDGTQNKTKRAGDDLVVVYAVAPADRLAQALNDVTQHPDIVDWSSQLPLQLAGNPALAESLSKKQETASQKSADKRQESEMAEAQQFVDALVLRSNSGQLAAGPVTNPSPPQALGGGKDGTQNPLPQAARNSANDRKSGGDEQRNSVSPGKVGYEVLHVPPSNSVSQYSPRSRGLAQQQYGGFENQAGRRQIASVAQLPAEKSVRNDAGNRAVRMLFVLHPAQADSGQSTPAAKPGK